MLWRLETGITLHGLYLGTKSDCDALLQSSGLLDVGGISYLFYVEQPYIQSMLMFAWQTQGAHWLLAVQRCYMYLAAFPQLTQQLHVLATRDLSLGMC